MSTQTCSTCGKSKANLECGLCHQAICKACAHFLEPDQFSFLPRIPPELSHTTYCEACFNDKVTPQIESYAQTLEAAREVIIFEKNQGKETRLIKRDEELVYVTDCPDYDEAILKMAFLAVLIKCNAVIDIDLKSKKIKSGGYQSTVWSGSGRPANVKSDQLIKDRSFRDNPN